ncbi:Acetyl esterase/lipase [Singulisphaera sp. GP187]|uniref:alpha/beta hydrolase n=1 Tax=Singulisphaera sp. GP187 TaxID=1882752 RepID=UPI00092846DB|nr:alpha/beta hydrolase [Singulisphaera sp. GP187]SIO60964.1 Acetyl esterase/lipase [Singulisphaera sp. GP187]
MFGRIPRLFAMVTLLIAMGAIALAQADVPGGAPPLLQQDAPKKKQRAFVKQKVALPILEGVKIERDLTYAKLKANRALKLDLYVPETALEKLPLIVWIHGGGWRRGSKYPTGAATLSTKGYVVASIEYRLSSEAQFPAQIEDCKAALRWLRAHAKTYHIDPDKVGAWGSSAGGHLVALLGTAGDKTAWDVGDHLDQSSRVQAVCDFFGPADFSQIHAEHAAKAEGAVAQLLGGSVSEKPDAARDASPITHITKEDPPFLICHGTEDPLVPLKQSLAFHAALTKAGVHATLVKVERGGHGFRSDTNPTSGEVLQRVQAFFDKELKPTP